MTGNLWRDNPDYYDYELRREQKIRAILFWIVVLAAFVLLAAVAYADPNPAPPAAGGAYRIQATVVTADGVPAESYPYQPVPVFSDLAACEVTRQSEPVRLATADVQARVDVAGKYNPVYKGATVKLDCVPIR